MAKLLFIGLILFGAWLFLRRSAPTPPIDEKEARAILGVDRGADADAIRAAHRRLVAAVHPDRGGSAELARRINAARDTLLKRRD
jgi:DnaJ homolog subfamily C member 19